MTHSKSESRPPLLAALNLEITALARTVMSSIATVAGQTKDFDLGGGSAWLYGDTHLVTNNHVVEDLVGPVSVQLSDDDEIRATVVGRDEFTDLAVLEISDGHQRAALRLRNGPPALGEICFAFGSPLGEFRESITFGIVSGLKRTLATLGGRAIPDVIQTDCAINPGNSGGPLVGIDGRVLGVNTAGIDGAAGLGFAVPADTVADIVPELIERGSIAHASLGVGVAVRRVEIDSEVTPRLVVTRVRPTAAGPFEPGDVLLSVGQREISGQQDLMRVLRGDLVNKTVPVRVSRNGAQMWIDCVPSRVQPS